MRPFPPQVLPGRPLMRRSLSLLLRCVMLLAFGLNGVALAHAAVAAPPAAPAHHMAAAGDHSGHAVAGQANCPSLAGDTAPAHGCCKGGVCACTCAAPAVAGTVHLAVAVPVAHDLIVALFDYQPSHLLPQPYRPPIA